MLALITSLLAAFLRTFRIRPVVRPSANIPDKRPSTTRNRRAERKTQARAPRPVRVKLSRITSPTLALRLLADTQGEVSGRPKEADQRDLETAWMQLGDPTAQYVQALIALGSSVPRFIGSQDEEDQMAALLAKARTAKQTFIQAIWKGAAIKISAEAETALARRIERLSGGQIPAPVLTDGPVAEHECHVIDSYNRPVICRAIAHGPKRPLEILDAPGGTLHRETIALSCWAVKDGWLPVGGFRPPAGRRADGDGLPNHDLKPKSSSPKA
jgi:hypothetical protein